MRTKAGLLTEMAAAFEFPSYFGNNWDALEECWRDLQWFDAAGYVMVVAEALQLLRAEEDDRQFGIFMDILRGVAEEWANPRQVSNGGTVPTENLVWPITAPRRARVTCYTAPLHLVDFKCASSFGEAQDYPVAIEEAYAMTRYAISRSTPKIPARFADPIVSLPPYQFAIDTLNRAESAPPSPGQTREGSQNERRGAR